MTPAGARIQFQDELARLERQALEGVEMVLTALDLAVESLDRRDAELAARVIADDDRIDGRYLEVHQGILSLLATQAPVAGDLRTAAALLHVVKYVERMGDQCVNMAKLIPLADRAAGDREEIVRRIDRMAALVREEVVAAREAFARRDAEAAERLVERDGEVNRLNREVFQLALDAGADARRREWATFMVLVARCLERVGDYAVDIGEQTAFVVTGRFREFSDASH
jgi:phosphate transport system protein